MTYVDIAYIVKTIIGEDAIFNVTSMLRFAENDFIERTLCLWKYDLVNTSTLNDGTLSATYTLPTGFVQFIKFEWEGSIIPPVHQAREVTIYQANGTLYTGTPQAYQIEGETFRLIPKPLAHGYMSRWYVYKNTATSGTSPIIPLLEHEKLADYVAYRYYETENNFNPIKAVYFKEKYLDACALTYQRYKRRMATQYRIYDGVSEGLTLQERCPEVTG